MNQHKKGLFEIAVLTICLVTSAVIPSRGYGSVGLEGKPPFSFFAWFSDRPKLGDIGRLRVSMRGVYPDTAVGVARIILPPALTLVGGDTLRRAHPARGDAEWTVEVRPVAVGHYEIRGVLRIEDARGVADEGEFLLSLEIRSDTLIAGDSKPIRAEHIRGIQRYRYGGEYLVPIDGPEYLMQSDIRPSAKPRILERSAAVDTLGRGAGPRNIHFVVFIDPKGNIRDLRPQGGAGRDSYLVVIGRKALERWRFAAATANGRPVTDWLEVKVEIIPPK